jgi:hypothetical protein
MDFMHGKLENGRELGLFRQDALVNFQHLGRGKRFFSGNPPVVPGKASRP